MISFKTFICKQGKKNRDWVTHLTGFQTVWLGWRETGKRLAITLKQLMLMILQRRKDLTLRLVLRLLRGGKYETVNRGWLGIGGLKVWWSSVSSLQIEGVAGWTERRLMAAIEMMSMIDVFPGTSSMEDDQTGTKRKKQRITVENPISTLRLSNAFCTPKDF